MRAPDRRSAATTTIAAGFTLIELLAVLAVTAVALTIAIPGFTYLIVSNRLTATANLLVGSVTQARLEAVKRNNLVQFCAGAGNGTDALGTACGSSAGAVFATDADGTIPRTAVQTALVPPNEIQLGTGGNGAAAMTALRFGGDGLGSTIGGNGPYTGLVADIYSSAITTNNHRCIYLTTGTIVSSCDSDSSCPASEPSSCQ